LAFDAYPRHSKWLWAFCPLSLQEALASAQLNATASAIVDLGGFGYIFYFNLLESKPLTSSSSFSVSLQHHFKDKYG
jgi:hypothetical protein